MVLIGPVVIVAALMVIAVPRIIRRHVSTHLVRLIGQAMTGSTWP